MLRLVKAASYSITFFICLITILCLIPLRSKDLSNYLQFKKMSEQEASYTQAPSLSKHQKTGVIKDIWYQKQAMRLHYHIQCDESTLVFVKKGHNTSLEEKMYSIQSWFQENVTENSQDVRYFWADEGEYFYDSQTFLATKVHLAFYEQEGSTLHYFLPEKSKMYMRGLAKEASLTLNKHQNAFKAHQFSAHVQSGAHR